MTLIEEKQIAKSWRKARIAAMILLREEGGRLTARDVRIGQSFAQDRSVSPRLIQQALNGYKSRKRRLANPGGTTVIQLGREAFC